MLTWDRYVKLRDSHKGQGVRSKFLKLAGVYDPEGGTLEQLNKSVDVYIRTKGGLDELDSVFYCIDNIARSPKVEKYGFFLAELLLLLPDRYTTTKIVTRTHKAGLKPPTQFKRTLPKPAHHELLSAFAEAQHESAYRIFIEGAYSSGGGLIPPQVTWKKGAVKSTIDMMKAWTTGGADAIRGAAQEPGADPAIVAVARQAGNPEALKQAGRTAIQGGRVAVSAGSDRVNAALRRAPLAVPELLLGAPDMYEVARAGASGFSDTAGFSFADIGCTDLESKLSVLTTGGMEKEAADYCISAVGLAMSCLGVATGLVSEIRAAITASNSLALKKSYEVVPFGSATSAVNGIRELLNRYSAELAAMGAMDITGGATSLAGAGPVGGLVTLGLKILLLVRYAVRDAAEVQKARELLSQKAEWKNKLFVMKAMSEVPLFAAYYTMAASSSDLIGLLTDPNTFNAASFKDGVMRVNPQLEFMRNMANTCQMNAMWGFEPMTGWMQCLDTRWYKQPQKEAFNAFQDIKRADKAAMKGRVQFLRKRFES